MGAERPPIQAWLGGRLHAALKVVGALDDGYRRATIGSAVGYGHGHHAAEPHSLARRLEYGLNRPVTVCADRWDSVGAIFRSACCGGLWRRPKRANHTSVEMLAMHVTACELRMGWIRCWRVSRIVERNGIGSCWPDATDRFVSVVTETACLRGGLRVVPSWP